MLEDFANNPALLALLLVIAGSLATIGADLISLFKRLFIQIPHYLIDFFHLSVIHFLKKIYIYDVRVIYEYPSRYLNVTYLAPFTSPCSTQTCR